MVIATQVCEKEIAKRVRSKRISGATQLGYQTSQGWVGVTNLYRQRGGWVSDNYPGWWKTVQEWKNSVEQILNVKG